MVAERYLEFEERPDCRQRASEHERAADTEVPQISARRGAVANAQLYRNP